jgi:hypothetical protein
MLTKQLQTATVDLDDENITVHKINLLLFFSGFHLH